MTTSTRERPILFSGPMVRAILSGQKTQTRRAVRLNDAGRAQLAGKQWHIDDPHVTLACPYGQPGDRLWVRETWQHANHPDGPYRPGVPVHYRADYFDDPHGPDGERSPGGKYRAWRPSIHMPRAASRITLEITGVRVERLQDTSETDALAEGVTIEEHHKHGYCSGEALPPAVRAFRELWESINGAGTWAANPWAWVMEFRRVES